MLCAQVHGADIADRDGTRPLLEAAAARFAKLKHLWADAGYRGQLVAWIKEHLGWSVEVVLPPRRWVRCPEGVEPPPLLPAFTVLKRRWVVERTFEQTHAAPSLPPGQVTPKAPLFRRPLVDGSRRAV